MTRSQLLQTEAITRMLHKVFCKRDLVILIGSKGSLLTSMYEGTTVESVFIPKEEQLNLEKYKSFFKKFRKSQVFILLDSAECRLKQASIPVLQGVVKTDPIKQFISDHYFNEDIVAHSISRIDTNSSETWNTSIASFTADNFFNNLLDCILTASLTFAGVYFLGLELEPIIEDLISKTGNLEYQNELQIFVTTMSSAGIKLVVKHKSDILLLKNIDYPVDKSDQYIQGVIEQEVNDCLIALKRKILQENLKVCIIILVDQNLIDLLKNSVFTDCAVVLLPHKNSLSGGERFTDNSIIELFLITRKYLGLNKELSSIMVLNRINGLIFKPIIVIVLILVASVVSVKLDIWRQKQKTALLNERYYKIAEEYREFRAKYSGLANIANLADIYSLEPLIRVPTPRPFALVDSILSSLNENIHLVKIKWELLNKEPNYSDHQTVNLEVSLQFIDKAEEDQIHQNIVHYIKGLQDKLREYNITWIINSEDSVLALKTHIVPVIIHITGPEDGN